MKKKHYEKNAIVSGMAFFHPPPSRSDFTEGEGLNGPTELAQSKATRTTNHCIPVH